MGGVGLAGGGGSRAQGWISRELPPQETGGRAGVCPGGLGWKEALRGEANWRLPPPAGVLWCGGLVRGCAFRRRVLAGAPCWLAHRRSAGKHTKTTAAEIGPLFLSRLWEWLSPAPPANCVGTHATSPLPGEAEAGRGQGRRQRPRAQGTPTAHGSYSRCLTKASLPRPLSLGGNGGPPPPQGRGPSSHQGSGVPTRAAGTTEQRAPERRGAREGIFTLVDPPFCRLRINLSWSGGRQLPA